jgi:hypothetical protein
LFETKYADRNIQPQVGSVNEPLRMIGHRRLLSEGNSRRTLGKFNKTETLGKVILLRKAGGSVEEQFFFACCHDWLQNILKTEIS